MIYEICTSVIHEFCTKPSGFLNTGQMVLDSQKIGHSQCMIRFNLALAKWLFEYWPTVNQWLELAAVTHGHIQLGFDQVA